MAIKNIIAKGIGFAPATKKWIPTHGFSSGAAVSTPSARMFAETIGPPMLAETAGPSMKAETHD